MQRDIEEGQSSISMRVCLRERENMSVCVRNTNLETRLKCLWPNKIWWVHTLPQGNKIRCILKVFTKTMMN